MRKVWIVAAGLVLAGCAGGGTNAQPADTTSSSSSTSSTISSTPTPTAEPKTATAVKAMAQEEADRYSAGDWEGAWELWTAEGKAAVTAEDYARFHDTCSTSGVPLKVVNVRVQGDVATIRIEALGFQQAYKAKYENGAWRWQPNASDLRDYRGGVDKMIKDGKADGSCDGDS